MPCFPALLTQYLVHGDPMQPGGHAGLATETAQIAPGLDKGGLGSVFRRGNVRRHAQTQSVDPANRRAVERFECSVIAVPRLMAQQRERFIRPRFT